MQTMMSVSPIKINAMGKNVILNENIEISKQIKNFDDDVVTTSKINYI